MRRNINPYEVVLVVFLLIASSGAFILALGYSARGQLFPLIVIVLLIIMLVLKLFAVFSPKMAARVDIQGIEFPDHQSASGPAEGLSPQRADMAKWPKELMMLFWLVFLLAGILLVGFLPTVPIFLLLFMKFQGKHGWTLSILICLFVLAFIYGLFGIVLSVQFPEGLLFSD